MPKQHLNPALFQLFSFALVVLVLVFVNLDTCNGKLSANQRQNGKDSNLNRDRIDTLENSLLGPVFKQKRNNLSPEPKAEIKDRHFGLKSSVFEDYLKQVDLSLLPGFEATEDDFENWTPPKDIQRQLPSYISGFDYKNRPILVVEYGHYNYTKYATGNKDEEALFHKYFRYLTYILLKSHAIKSTSELPVNQHVILIDFQGLNPENVLNPKALKLQLRWVKDYKRISKKYCAKMIFVNVNPITELLFNVGRSFLLSFVDQIEIYNTNKAEWQPQLLKSFPKDQIPEWYGGSKGFKPIFISG